MPIIAKNKIRNKTKQIYKQIPFKDITYPELIEEINQKFPIKLKKMDLVNRIHKRYPLASKEEVAQIVRSVFEVLRESIIGGYSTTVRYIFNEFRLELIKSGKFNILKVKNRTYPSIRKRDYDV